jgi:hypothetical protein
VRYYDKADDGGASMNHAYTSLVRDGDILAAVQQVDLHTALAYLQAIASIPTGDVAAAVFSGFDWSSADLTRREEKLCEYLSTEEMYSS